MLACAAAAALLAASQFTNLFELTPPGGEALGEVEADDQHGYATLIVAVLAWCCWSSRSPRAASRSLRAPASASRSAA